MAHLDNHPGTQVVVWPVLLFESCKVGEVSVKLLWEALTQRLDAGLQLDIQYVLETSLDGSFVLHGLLVNEGVFLVDFEVGYRRHFPWEPPTLGEIDDNVA